MQIDVAANIAQIISLGIPVAAGIYAGWRKLESRQADNYLEMIRINDKLDYIEKQFGPNGGGLREAVNNLAKHFTQMETRLTKIGDDVANLSGKFEQHIAETDKQ